jgi:putative ABC transport system substrate-binding protein
MRASFALSGIGLLAGCGGLLSQGERLTPVARVAVLYPGSVAYESTPHPLGQHGQAFEAGLGELGWVAGRNVTIEYLFGDDLPERLTDRASELGGLEVDVIVTVSTPAAQAARDATTSTPIVMIAAGDVVGGGLAASVARPGGRLTGLSMMPGPSPEKLLELLKETLPGLARVAFFYDPFNAARLKGLEAAAQTLALQLLSWEVRGPEDLEGAFTALAESAAQALFVPLSPFFYRNSQQIADLALRRRVPTIFNDRHFVLSGGLMSYGVSLTDQYRRAASFVDKILRGAAPGDLPIEQPMRFELVVNLKTAQALGLTIPRPVLEQATELLQ